MHYELNFLFKKIDKNKTQSRMETQKILESENLIDDGILHTESISLNFKGFNKSEFERCSLNLETGFMITIVNKINMLDKNDNVFHKEISILNIEQDIKDKAIEIFEKMNLENISIKGVINRKKCKFVCLYYAYEELRPTDPRNVAELVGLDQNKINKAITTFSESQTGYSPVKRETSATELIGELMKKLGIKNGFFEAEQFCNSILEKNIILIKENPHKLDKEYLKNMSPQNVAAAILLLYLQIHGIKININTFPEIVGKKRATIESIYNIVLTTYSYKSKNK
jgi:transcription initiation factor TFIIIB Brf1 subunit/transcription initiation factor TFIIB